MTKMWSFFSIAWVLIGFSFMFAVAFYGFEPFAETVLFPLFKSHVIIGLVAIIVQSIPSKKHMNL